MSTEEQIAYLKSRLKDNPKSLVFARLADLYLDQNRVDEAIRLCAAGVKHNPSYVTGNYVLAKAYILADDYENAESALKQVIVHDREFLAAHKLLGDLMRKLGWENKAVAHYRDIIQIDPLEEKVRHTLDLLNESDVEEHIDQPNLDQDEIELDETDNKNAAVSDWMDEIREVFPDEIKPEFESPPPEDLTFSESFQPHEPETVTEDMSDAEPDEILTDMDVDKSELLHNTDTDSDAESQLASEEPVISENPEFFAIKNDEGKNLPVEEIAAEFLTPEQLSDTAENQIGEEVVSGEVEISEVKETIESEKSAESEDISFKDEQPDQSNNAGSGLEDVEAEDGSDFAQALDALEAMDSESASITEDQKDAADKLSETAQQEKSESVPQDEPLVYEDSGLEAIEKPTEAENPADQSISEAESTAGESLFEWELPAETAQNEHVEKPENKVDSEQEEIDTREETPFIQEQPDMSAIETSKDVSESAPRITMTPDAAEESESFTLEELNLDIEPEPPAAESQPPGKESESAINTSGIDEKLPEPETMTKPSPVQEKQAKTEPPVAEADQSKQLEESSEEKSSEKIREKPAKIIVTPTLGEIYAAQGQYKKAIAVFEELLKQNPNEKKYQEKIAELKRNLENSL